MTFSVIKDTDLNPNSSDNLALAQFITQIISSVPKGAVLLNSIFSQGNVTIRFVSDELGFIKDERGLDAIWDATKRELVTVLPFNSETLNQTMILQLFCSIVQGLSIAGNSLLLKENMPDPLNYPNEESYASAMAQREYNSYIMRCELFQEISANICTSNFQKSPLLNYQQFYYDVFKVSWPNQMQSLNEHYESIYKGRINSCSTPIRNSLEVILSLSNAPFLIQQSPTSEYFEELLANGKISLDSIDDVITHAEQLLLLVAEIEKNGCIETLSKFNTNTLKAIALNAKTRAREYLSLFIDANKLNIVGLQEVQTTSLDEVFKFNAHHFFKAALNPELVTSPYPKLPVIVFDC